MYNSFKSNAIDIKLNLCHINNLLMHGIVKKDLHVCVYEIILRRYKYIEDEGDFV